MFTENYTLIERVLKACTDETEIALTDGGEHADLASTVAFALAKKRHQAPKVIAEELAATLNANPELAGIRVEALGPYLNFSFGPEYLRETLKAAVQDDFGTSPKKPVRVVLEHTSANPNGPLHVGHIRNSILGDTLARAFRKAGYRVEVQYYVNDMGRQIAIVAYGFDHLDTGAEPGEKEDHHIARVYVAANRDLEANPDKGAEIDERMQLIEKRDPATATQFRELVSRCLDGFKVTMQGLNVKHDRFIWESDFVKIGDMEKVLGRLAKLPQAVQPTAEDGTFSLDLSSCGYKKSYVLRRSDGTSVYAARDLAYHIWKGRNFDRVIDVLGADHKLIAGQLVCTLRLIAEKPPEVVHFEFVSLPEGSMSTRAGTFVSADELIEEMQKRAIEEVRVRRPELPVEECDAIAASVGRAAIRYDIIKVSPEKSTVFDWKEALDFDRQSGPYVQYAHARACSILDRAGPFQERYDLLESPYEIALAKHIAKFPHVIESVVRDLRPHMLATYARDLADLFNTFYHYDPVLKGEGPVRESRLTLVLAAEKTLKEVLETLGIDALRSM
jgi:arginyl-tRNA synthetase